MHFIMKYLIEEVTGDPKSDSEKEFTSTLTFISVSKELPKVNSGYNDDDIFTNLQKGSLYDLMLDRVLTPRGFGGVEFNNYFIRLQWSPHPFDSARPYYKPRCLLAGLTSNFQLKIYDKKYRRQYIDKTSVSNDEDLIPQIVTNKPGKDTEEDSDTVKYHDGWLPLLDLAKTYNDILCTEWNKKNSSRQEFCFDTYKSRLYELSVIDFSWIEPWDEEEMENEHVAIMMTFQCNGDIAIWRITLAEVDDLPLKSELIFKDNLLENSIIACHKYTKITDHIAVLAVGLKNGCISVFRVERHERIMVEKKVRKGEPGEEEQEERSIFWFDNAESLWEADQLQIEVLDFIVIPHEEEDEEALCLWLLAVKHPNTIISFRLQILEDRIVCEKTHCCQSPFGHIVDMKKYTSDVFLVNHADGQLSFVEIGPNGQVYFMTDREEFAITDGDKEDEVTQQTGTQGEMTETIEPPSNVGLWLHHGFDLSPNKTLCCFSKALTMKHDTIIVKEPSECTFVSLFPTKDAWPWVKEQYSVHDYNLAKIHDILQGFRHQMRVSKDYDPYRCLDGKTLTEMNLEEVKLYLWTLKAMGLPKPWKFMKDDYIPKDEIARMKLNIIKNIVLSEERVMEQNLTNVLKTYEGKKKQGKLKTPLNLRSSFVIRQYLQSKPSPKLTKSSSEYISSACPDCGEEFSFLNNAEYNPATGLTNPGIPGYKWKGQTCTSQHPVSVCVLSLVPLDYPNRVCPYCGCAALMEPAFGQLPICPFCDEFMEFEPMIYDEEENQEPSNESMEVSD